MSNVWETRSRLFLEDLEKLVEWLSGDAPIASDELEEQTVRLLAVTVMLLRQHQLNKRGQCQFCGSMWTWRLRRRQQRCTFHQALDLVMSQSLDVVWWLMFESVGQEWSLAEVRAWVTGREKSSGYTGPC